MTSPLDSRLRPTLDPIIKLQVPLETASRSQEEASGSRLSVSSVCFLSSTGICSSDSLSESDSSDDEAVSFRCRDLVKEEKRRDDDITADARQSAASLSLSGMRLASCHSNGDTFVWDLRRRRIVSDFCERRGQGMALRRLGGSSTNILYHTRDPLGTVSIHDADRNNVVTTFETHSLSFCTAAPCAGSQSLIVLPTENRCYAAVRDIRVPPDATPIVRFHSAGLDEGDNEDKHGMLMSLAMSEANEDFGRPVVSCGMESGTTFFHDLRVSQYPIETKEVMFGSKHCQCSIKLGKDPIIGIDLAPSATTSGNKRSFVSIAGLAGDAAELSELPVEERGTVAVIKASFDNDETELTASARLRARVSTCKVGGPDEPVYGGKPGVGLCRFRPDGRIFGVGGWDRRVRIFDRTGKAAPLAILKGHEGSVTALDWAPDSQTTGFLATGAGDGCIYIWRCLPS